MISTSQRRLSENLGIDVSLLGMNGLRIADLKRICTVAKQREIKNQLYPLKADSFELVRLDQALKRPRRSKWPRAFLRFF